MMFTLMMMMDLICKKCIGSEYVYVCALMAFDSKKMCMYDASGSYTCRRVVTGKADIYAPMEDSGLAYNVPFLAREGRGGSGSGSGGRVGANSTAFTGYMLLGSGAERFTVNASQHRDTQYRELMYKDPKNARESFTLVPSPFAKKRTSL